MTNKQSIKKGFTLIELLVVIAIIALLAGIILVRLTSTKDKVRYTKTISDMETIQKAAEMFYYRHGRYDDLYPSGDSKATADLSQFISGDWPAPPCPGWEYTYNVFNDHYAVYPDTGHKWTPIVRIDLIRPRINPDKSKPDPQTIFYICIQPNQDGKCTCNDATAPDWWTGPPYANQDAKDYCMGYQPIANISSQTLDCDTLSNMNLYPSGTNFYFGS